MPDTVFAISKAKNTKIALLISGHTRSIDRTIENLCEIKRLTGCDVYVHQWAEPEMTTATWRQPEKYLYDKSVNASIQTLLQPKSILIESSESVNSKIFSELYKSHPTRKFSGTHFMLYGIWRAFRLVVEQCDAQNAQYDVIIRYRFDLLCSDPKKILIDVNDVINESKFIKMPEHNWAKAADLFFDGVLIASFTTYSRILSSLHLEFNSRFLHLHEDENLFPELLIAESITSLRIKIKSTCAEFKLIRKDGLCEQVFTANSSILNRCISNYSLCEYLRRSRDGYVVKQLVRRCSNQTNIVFFVLARLFYPLIKIIKSLQSKV